MARASIKTVVLLFQRLMVGGYGPSITPDSFNWCIKQIDDGGIPLATIKDLTS